MATLEAKYGIRLTDDFREYLLQSCPKDDTATDNNIIDWWQLTRIKTIAEEYEHPIRNPIVVTAERKYLFFADYCIWCWAWAIGCGDDDNRGRIVVINGISDHFVADSFAQFVDRYVENPWQLA